MKRILCLCALLLALPALPVTGEDVDVRAILDRAENARLGQTSQAKMTMTITTPRWTRVVAFRFWADEAADKTFIRILSPKKDRGTGFLRSEGALWTYLPRVERTMRIPPSMMMQSWMGSDFTNDDLSRESSLIKDYTASLLRTEPVNGDEAWVIKLVPLEEAPIVWSKLELFIRKADDAPLLYLFYDEPDPARFELVRRMRFSDIVTVKGRPMPTAWSLEPLDKEGHTTAMLFEDLVIDEPIDAAIFSQANLKRSEAVR